MSKKYLFWITPNILPASYLASIWRETFHVHETVQFKAKRLYPKGLALKDETLLSKQIKHIFEETFAFVPYETTQTLQQLLEEGRQHGVTPDNFKLLKRSADKTYAILRTPPNISESLEVSMQQDETLPDQEKMSGEEPETKMERDDSLASEVSYLHDDTRLVQVVTKLTGSQRAQLAPELKSDHVYPARNDMLLRTFCAQLRRARDAGWFKDSPADTDELLILSAISKSGRQDLLQSMTESQYKDVEKFIDFLKACEGRTREDLRNDLRDFRQLPNEPQYLMLGRLMNLYSELRGWNEQPSLDILSTDPKFDFDSNEILSHMIEGQSDHRVTSLLKQHRNELRVNNVASIAKRLAASLPKNAPVNTVTLQNEKLTKLETQLQAISVNLAKVSQKGGQSKQGKFKGKCRLCDSVGHKATSCWYADQSKAPKSWKPKAETLKKVKEKVAKRSQS